MATLETGTIIDGKYQVGKLIGEGAMGAVYEGEHLRISRRVAIKVLHAEAALQPEVRKRFEKEAHAAARIRSRHICDVLDVGDLPDGGSYLVMELLDGEDLDRRIKARGKISSADAALIVYQLLDGLAAMHDAGVVHRDLKPANIFLTRSSHGREVVKILDFGVSKFATKPGEGSMTATGVVMGTPFYMAPEQARGDKSVDQRADLYSVGVILYEAVTGRLPFTGKSFQEIFLKIVLETAPAVEEVEPDADPELANVIRKAMSREREDRYQSAAEMQDVIREFAALRGLALNPAYSISPSAPAPPPSASIAPHSKAPPAPLSSARAMVEVEPEPAHGAKTSPRVGTPIVVGLVALLAIAVGGGITLLVRPTDSAIPASNEPEASVTPVDAGAAATAPPASAASSSVVVRHDAGSSPAVNRDAAPPPRVAMTASVAAPAVSPSAGHAASPVDASTVKEWGPIEPTVPTTAPSASAAP